MSKQHWDSIYHKTDLTQLGWYQSDPQPDLDLILNLDLDDQIVIAGAGSTLLVDELHSLGFTNLIIIDISFTAMHSIQERIGDNDYTWIVDDLTHPIISLDNITLWYDRAVLHFFTNPVDRSQYASLINKSLISTGYVILAQFSTEGASKCSGLDVFQFDVSSLSSFLGPLFELKRNFPYVYTNPGGGDRPYIYTIFQRMNN